GAGFDASLAAAGPDDGERPHLADLYQEIPEDYVMRVVTRPGGRQQTQQMDWDRTKPPPDGWERGTGWDSRGYWRLKLHPPLPGTTALPALVWGPEPSPPERRFPARITLMDQRRWATSGDPDAMLEYLLKQEEVSWRKVRLWACACVRRIWPQLATEPS